jgi:hypothetical protein
MITSRTSHHLPAIELDGLTRFPCPYPDETWPAGEHVDLTGELAGMMKSYQFLAAS